MPEDITEEIWKLYENLPEELKEAIFSEKTANNIYDICTKNGIEDDRASEIARYTGWVFLGLLPPEEFQKTLEKKIKLNKELAKNVSYQIDRFVFLPLKGSLDLLYGKEVEPIKEPLGPTPPVGRKPSKKDIYREPIE